MYLLSDLFSRRSITVGAKVISGAKLQITVIAFLQAQRPQVCLILYGYANTICYLAGSFICNEGKHK